MTYEDMFTESQVLAAVDRVKTRYEGKSVPTSMLVLLAMSELGPFPVSEYAKREAIAREYLARHGENPIDAEFERKRDRVRRAFFSESPID